MEQQQNKQLIKKYKFMSPGRKQTWKNRGENNDKQTDRQTETVSEAGPPSLTLFCVHFEV